MFFNKIQNTLEQFGLEYLFTNWTCVKENSKRYSKGHVEKYWYIKTIINKIQQIENLVNLDLTKGQ